MDNGQLFAVLGVVGAIIMYESIKALDGFMEMVNKNPVSALFVASAIIVLVHQGSN